MKNCKNQEPYMQLVESFSETPYYESIEQFEEVFKQWIISLLRNHTEAEEG